MTKSKIKGNVEFDPTVDYSEVEEITGYLNCYGSDTTASFPKLTTVGGDLYCSGSDTRVSFPKLTTVGGYLYCSGSDTRASFPKLTIFMESLGEDVELKKAKETIKKALEEVRIASEHLLSYGDVNYDMMTQGGNQGLRHVHYALSILEGEDEG